MKKLETEQDENSTPRTQKTKKKKKIVNDGEITI